MFYLGTLEIDGVLATDITALFQERHASHFLVGSVNCYLTLPPQHPAKELEVVDWDKAQKWFKSYCSAGAAA